MPPVKHIKPSELARQCGVHIDTIYNWIERGHLRVARTLTGRILIPESERVRILESMSLAAPEEKSHALARAVCARIVHAVMTGEDIFTDTFWLDEYTTVFEAAQIVVGITDSDQAGVLSPTPPTTPTCPCDGDGDPFADDGRCTDCGAVYRQTRWS